MTASPATVDFRDLCRSLHGARVEASALELGAGRLALAVEGGSDDPSAVVELVFDRVTLLRWQREPADPAKTMLLSTVGLERLAADDVWRLYLGVDGGRGGVLELSCRRITAGGAEVTGVGRSFRDVAPPPGRGDRSG